MLKFSHIIYFSLLVALAASAVCDVSKTNCDTCTGTGPTDTCSTCVAGFYIKTAGTCDGTCDAGCNGAIGSCDATGCITCNVAANVGTNTETPNYYYLASGTTFGGAATTVNQCLSSLACYTGPGFYPKAAVGGGAQATCTPCDAKCNNVGGSCSDSNNCFVCDTDTPFLKYDVNPRVCVDSGTTLATGCPTPGFYQDTSNANYRLCKSCPTGCESTGGTCDSSGCLTCNTAGTLYLKTPSSGTGKTCVDGSTPALLATACPTGSYTTDATTKRCTAVITTVATNPSTASTTASSFNSTPNVVINAGTNTTDNTNWAVPASSVKYGAGPTNTTIYVYGLKTSTSTTNTPLTTISGIITRTINATIASNGTDSALNSVLAGGTLNPISGWPTLSPSGYYATQAVAGYLIVALSGFESQWTNNLYGYSWAGGATSSASGKVQLTNFANPTATSGAVYNYEYNPTSIWLEDGFAYVAFTQIQRSWSVGTNPPIQIVYGVSTQGSSTNLAAYVQGFNVATGALVYNDTSGKTSPKAVVSGLTTNTVSLGLVCGPSNYTNSTSINCLYKSGADSAKYTVSYVSLARSTGVAGSPSTVATANAATTASSKAGDVLTSYQPAGIITGAYGSGGLVSVKTETLATTYPTGSNTDSYALWWWNTTSGTGTFVNTGFSGSGVVSHFTASGGTNGLGYYIQAVSDLTTTSTASPPVTTSAYSYSIASFFQNSTSNGSLTTLATLWNKNGQYFLDNNGSVWFGYSTSELASASSATPSVAQGNIYTGVIGKVLSQVGVWASFGSVISTFFASLSLVLLALFAF